MNKKTNIKILNDKNKLLKNGIELKSVKNGFKLKDNNNLYLQPFIYTYIYKMGKSDEYYLYSKANYLIIILSLILLSFVLSFFFLNFSFLSWKFHLFTSFSGISFFIAYYLIIIFHHQYVLNIVEQK
ncbi:hypothetical protein GCM10011506_32570 [Marivirga lumbricoides]|uniref:Uncharacterized protein n=1 Tax=Marivirga lumbricoides TaxID=1046115 RepID=A0ABQ1MPY8_9BACT|nr:hypothetical protein GCM10011506_32570 [Marivirga lumbricoides]